MRKYEKNWESMKKVEKACLGSLEFIRISTKSWESMRKYEQVWESMQKYEQV